ncbi:MAG: dienelactone hydrolase family protein [Ornithinimicrobium sp.]
MVFIDLTEASSQRGGSVPLRGYLALTHGGGPWPGVVVVHEIFGFDANSRAQADRLAALGYAALAVDLYSAGGAKRCLVATMRSVLRGSGRAFTDIETARLALLERADVTDRIGIIGFCMGGGFALLTADADRYGAASVNYGMLPKDLDSIAALCPVVGSYGAEDRSLKGAAGQLGAALDAHGIERDITEYPGVGHSFLNELPTGPRPLQPLFRVLGVTPEPDVITDSWGRIDAFFSAHLRPDMAGPSGGSRL